MASVPEFTSKSTRSRMMNQSNLSPASSYSSALVSPGKAKTASNSSNSTVSSPKVTWRAMAHTHSLLLSMEFTSLIQQLAYAAAGKRVCILVESISRLWTR